MYDTWYKERTCVYPRKATRLYIHEASGIATVSSGWWQGSPGFQGLLQYFRMSVRQWPKEPRSQNREFRITNSEPGIQNGDRGNRENRTVGRGNHKTRTMSAENVSLTSVRPETRVQNPSRPRIQNRELRIANSEQ